MIRCLASEVGGLECRGGELGLARECLAARPESGVSSRNVGNLMLCGQRIPVIAGGARAGPARQAQEVTA